MYALDAIQCVPKKARGGGGEGFKPSNSNMRPYAFDFKGKPFLGNTVSEF